MTGGTNKYKDKLVIQLQFVLIVIAQQNLSLAKKKKLNAEMKKGLLRYYKTIDGTTEVGTMEMSQIKQP